MTPHLYRSGQPERIQNRGSDVEQTGWFRDAVLRDRLGPCGRVKDGGHTRRALKNEECVRALPVVIEAFTVMGGNHDQRLVQRAAALEKTQKPPDPRTEVSQLRFVPRL